MKHHFTLTFKVTERLAVDVDEVASQMSGSDFHVEHGPLVGTEFTVHFDREGEHAADLLSYAREQVLSAVPNAELVSMDMSEEPPMMGVVDDITKLVIRACQLFGDPELAHNWLSRPQETLHGNVPKVLMVSAEGRTKVSRILTKLEDKS